MEDVDLKKRSEELRVLERFHYSQMCKAVHERAKITSLEIYRRERDVNVDKILEWGRHIAEIKRRLILGDINIEIGVDSLVAKLSDEGADNSPLNVCAELILEWDAKECTLRHIEKEYVRACEIVSKLENELAVLAQLPRVEEVVVDYDRADRHNTGCSRINSQDPQEELIATQKEVGEYWLKYDVYECPECTAEIRIEVKK